MGLCVESTRRRSRHTGGTSVDFWGEAGFEELKEQPKSWRGAVTCVFIVREVFNGPVSRPFRLKVLVSDFLFVLVCGDSSVRPLVLRVTLSGRCRREMGFWDSE